MIFMRDIPYAPLSVSLSPHLIAAHQLGWKEVRPLGMLNQFAYDKFCTRQSQNLTH